MFLIFLYNNWDIRFMNAHAHQILIFTTRGGGAHTRIAA